MIFKPKIKQFLKSVSLLLATLAVTLSLNTIQAHAAPNATGIDAEAMAASIISDITGVSNNISTDTVIDGVAAARTGYLCYLLTEDGAKIPGVDAKLLKSQSFYSLGSPTIKTTSLKGNFTKYSLDEGDKGVVPWPYTPFNKDKSSNHAQILSWMESKDGAGVMNSVKFVADQWGTDVALKFKNGEYILCLETVLHFKFSVPTDGMEKGDPPTVTFEEIKNLSNPNATDMDIKMTVKQINMILAQMWKEVELPSGGMVQVGNPVVGTPKDCLEYYHSEVESSGPNWFKAYLNNIALFTMMIESGGVGAKAGYTPWTGSTASDYRMPDEQVPSFGVALAVFKAKATMQTTCDEPKQPAPHPAPNESTGNCTIIKNYRTKIENNFTDDGCEVISNLGNEILIETENLYQVVGWATSSSQSSIDSTKWESEIASKKIRDGQNPTTVTLDETIGEKTLYVLLEKTGIKPEEDKDYNYKLTESSITRRIFFSEPDYRLTNMDNESEQVESQTFKWIIPAHRTSCPGNHPFTDECEGHDHTSDCPVKCSDTCTKTHPDTGGKHIAESCTDSHYCGQRCTTQYAKCSYGEWHEKNLKLEGFISSIHHIKLTYINQKQNKSK